MEKLEMDLSMAVAGGTGYGFLIGWHKKSCCRWM
jgi:hypothetical protein